jgi:hypothetical protein
MSLITPDQLTDKDLRNKFVAQSVGCFFHVGKQEYIVLGLMMPSSKMPEEPSESGGQNSEGAFVVSNPAKWFRGKSPKALVTTWHEMSTVKDSSGLTKYENSYFYCTEDPDARPAVLFAPKSFSSYWLMLVDDFLDAALNLNL